MKSPNNDVFNNYTILLESDCIIFIQKTFYGEFKKKNRDFSNKNMWLDENTLKTKNTKFAIS